ncbi:YveK family protein [Clostridium sp. 'White wine YQ']|uniref:YveK family protein n=1 Tax=Clostridium sp. 'White wine YQ' TaxID=3027474 RepID=UPI0023665B3A|nr:Wzz/FepE/Etk N-terminal domain-containing protein [Clostridium sp. 'White wine YQ']MDD7792765.1 Wzz/FepE/Etk N-terminal domain-containing protein [Clostridium sp. 'White wine YQ']
MELQEYIQLIKKRLLLIFLITLAAVFVSGVISFFVIKPTYQASISVDIGNNQVNTDKNTGNQNYNDVLMYQKLVKTYSIYAKSRAVAEDVVNELKLNKTPEELNNMITATPSSDTEFLTISVKSKSSDEAKDIANQVAKSLKTVTKKIKNVDNVQLVDDAVLPSSPISPKPFLNIGIAFILGIFISVGLVFLLEYLDNTVKDPDELEKLLELPVIGNIPLIEVKGKKGRAIETKSKKGRGGKRDKRHSNI